MATSKYSGSRYKPIDAAMPGWEDELKGRQDLNAQIDWMNGLLQQNPNNKQVQQYLLGMYGDLINPPQENVGDTIGQALDLINAGQTIGDESLTTAGKKMLSGSDTLQKYGYGSTDTAAANNSIYNPDTPQTFEDIIKNIDTIPYSDRSKILSGYVDQETDPTKKIAQDKIKDYFTGVSSGNNLGIADSAVADILSRIGVNAGQTAYGKGSGVQNFSGDYNANMTQFNKKYQQEKRPEYSKYLSAYGL